MASMVYRPSKTGRMFHLARDVDTGFVRAIIGPIGSGKSVTCVMDLLMIAMDQQPGNDNVRRTRFAIIRNTYRELLDTTVATFFTWVDQSAGHWSSLNMSFTLVQVLPDGTSLEAEFLFRALDKPDDIKKLLSLELTAAWINEAREIAKAVVDMVQGRVGRYPPPVLGTPATFFGLIMDTNPPDSDHWWYRLLEEDIPPNHRLFKQPSGLSAEAENISNLPKNYYTNMMHGKTKDWIDVYIHGKYGFIADGKPVYPEYNDLLHYDASLATYQPSPQDTIYIGLDFGLTPAAAFSTLTPSGSLVFFDELVTFDMGAVSFGRLLKERVRQRYPNNPVVIYGDPAGEQRAQTDEQTPFMVLAAQEVYAMPTYTNDYTIRREVSADLMMRLDFSGKPAFRLTPGVPMLRKACNGGYQYRRMQVSGDDRFMDRPFKNKFSHVAEAAQYNALGAVGPGRVIGGGNSRPVDYTQTDRLVA